MERPRSPEQGQDRTVVFFDVDNTLTTDFTMFPFTKFLHSRNLISDDAHNKVFSDEQLYRDEEIDYQQFALDVVTHFYEGLEGQLESGVLAAGEEFLGQYQETLMPFARELIDTMQQEGELIVVSGAQREAFLPLARTLGIPEENLYLLEGEVVDGKYTGRVKVNMAVEHEKRKVVNQVSSARLDYANSFAFGDSDGDIPILEAVENRFIIEPKDTFKRIVVERGWEEYIVNRYSLMSRVKQRISELKSKK